MDRAGITELFDYMGWAFERYARVLDDQPVNRFAELAPCSGWPSLAACFNHFVSGYDVWLNAAWSFNLGPLLHPGDSKVVTAWANEGSAPAPVIEAWPAMKDYYARCREAVRAAMAVPDAILFERRDIRGGLRSRADVITDLLLHERGHHGDINTLFYQLGLRPYFNDYSLYLTNPDDFILDEE